MYSLTAPQVILKPLKQLWNVHSPLAAWTLINVALLLFFVAGVFLDERIIEGSRAWLKPLKFAISVTIYNATMLWFLSLMKAPRRWQKLTLNLFGWIVVLTFVAEWFAIITQVIRGTTSHFNVATPFDAFLYTLMGTAVTVLWVSSFVIAGLLLFQRFKNPAFGWSLRLSIVIAIIGMSLGYLMGSPTAQQMAQWEAGAPITVSGAHSVGVPDGGEGLPFLGWSTQGGDLRIGHFIGMHALQVIPLLGLFVTRYRRLRRLSQGQQTALVWVGAVSYLSVTLLTTWQALRAQPLLQPDALTLSVLAAIVAATVLSAAGILSFGRRSPEALQNVHEPRTGVSS